jgi:predicted nucleic acid-binding Zn ribbon protein
MTDEEIAKLPTCLCCVGTQQLNPNWTCSVCGARLRADRRNHANPYCGNHRDHYFLSEHCRYCVFCSERCRDVALKRRAARLRRLNGEPTPDTICTVCGNPFIARRFNALTCSPACRQKQYRRRKALQNEALGQMSQPQHL